MSRFFLTRLRYGSLVNPSSADCRVGGSSLTMALAISSRLFFNAGALQFKAAFARFATVSVAVENMGSEFFHSIGMVSGITTNYPSSTSEGGNIPSLGSSVGRNPMR